ncbi:MAG: acyltransferase family protein [Bacteroidales bacterium]|nr:acyltransferase family protein [Bacteroidales bacterium]
MPETATDRQIHLDCAHGLMILHMMFFHLCDETIVGTPYYYPILHTLAFFMAWFFFKSGMFYRDWEIRDVIKTGFKRFIIPAVIFAVIGFAFYLLTVNPHATLSDEIKYFYVFGSVHGHTPIWFLFSLFAVQVIFTIIRKCKLNSVVIAVISLGLYFSSKYIGFRPYWIYNISLGLLFYSLGLLLKDHQYNRTITITCLVIYFGLYFFHTDIDFQYGLFKPFVIAIPWALAGCILTNTLFKTFPRLCVAPLSFFGRYAMEFYCTHIIILYAIRKIVDSIDCPLSGVFTISFLFAVYIVIFAIILHYFKLKHIQWMFGKSYKDK